MLILISLTLLNFDRYNRRQIFSYYVNLTDFNVLEFYFYKV